MKILNKILFRFIESCMRMISKNLVRCGIMSKPLMDSCYALFSDSPLPMKLPGAYVSLLRKGLLVLHRSSGEQLSREEVEQLLDGK